MNDDNNTPEKTPEELRADAALERRKQATTKAQTEMKANFAQPVKSKQ